MGVVWLATDELLARHVAIKETVRPPQLAEPDWAILKERSFAEARTAARLNHPNIVAVFDVFEHDGRPWLVMRFVPHPSLRDVLRDGGPLDPAQAARVGLSVLAAIRAAHAAGIVHRDVKPANILVGPDDEIYLTDFGLAAADPSSGLTAAGLVMGSPAYMAPERARNQTATPATDLWSLGATLYAAAEGHDPFERSGTIAVLTAIVSDEPAPPTRAGPLWPVISGLLRKDPLARLTAGQAESLLRRVCATAGAGTDLAGQTPAPAAFGGGALTGSDRTSSGDSGVGHGLEPTPSPAALTRPDAVQRPRRRVRLAAAPLGLAAAAGVALAVAATSGTAHGDHSAVPPPRQSPVAAARGPSARPHRSSAGRSGAAARSGKSVQPVSAYSSSPPPRSSAPSPEPDGPAPTSAPGQSPTPTPAPTSPTPTATSSPPPTPSPTPSGSAPPAQQSPSPAATTTARAAPTTTGPASPSPHSAAITPAPSATRPPER